MIGWTVGVFWKGVALRVSIVCLVHVFGHECMFLDTGIPVLSSDMTTMASLSRCFEAFAV